MTTDAPIDPLANLDGIRTDIEAHRAELPTDVVDCVGCHIAVNDVPALIAEVERLRIRDHIAELAIGYVSEPVENTDRVTERYYELEAAVRHMQAVDARSANLAREVAQHQRALRDRIRPKAQP